MEHRRIASPRKRRLAPLLGVAAIVLLSCLCPATLPGGGPAATAPADEVPATAPAGAATQPPDSGGGPPATLAPTEVIVTVIPPTAAVGDEYNELFDEEIAAPGQENVHTFTAAPGQEFFFGILEVDNSVRLTKWRLVDEAGTEYFNACLGCGQPGIHTLERGGTYRLIIGEPEPGVGRYRVVVASVRVHHFPIAIGDAVAAGVPEPGAGSIESPGARDMYSFEADPGTEVYFGIAQINGTHFISLHLVDEDSNLVFRGCFGCGNPGAITLERGGTYMLIVGSQTVPKTGTYELIIVPVRRDEFAYTLGAPLAAGQPGPGAGDIETPGGYDTYTFQAEAGQEVYFGVEEINRPRGLDFDVLEEPGSPVFESCLGCGDPGVYTLERGGTYRIVVGSDNVAETGTYGLLAVPVRTDEFAYTLGTPVADGQPGPGAGNIETPGARDVYTFNASPSQQISLDISNQDSVRGVIWSLVDETGEVVDSACLGCGGYPRPSTLERGGTYRLIIGGGRVPTTGTYELTIQSG